ncbi:MAG TPA: integrase core domain-containing protein [Polyangiaceae bacterium]|nr:integrase core domain-containing protein [Polyangiaceae bacterium]
MYAYLNQLESAEAVMKALAEWFEDYNSQHHHERLNMLAPRAFRLQAATC